MLSASASGAHTPQRGRRRPRAVVTMLTDDETEVDACASWACAIKASRNLFPMADGDAPLTHKIVAFGFAPKASLTTRLVGGGGEARQKSAASLENICLAVRRRVDEAPATTAAHGAIETDVFVDASSADLEAALQQVAHSDAIAAGSGGAVDLFVLPMSGCASWTSWISRSGQEKLLRSAVVRRPPSPAPPSTEDKSAGVVSPSPSASAAIVLPSSTSASTPVLLCRQPIAKRPVVALACVNHKHLMGDVPLAVRAAANILAEGDVLHLFSHLELPGAPVSMYSTETQWHEDIHESMRLINEQLAALAETVKRRYPHLRIAAVQSDDTFSKGLINAVTKNKVDLVAIGRGSRKRLIGELVHSVMSTLSRELYESVLIDVGSLVSAVMVV